MRTIKILIIILISIIASILFGLIIIFLFRFNRGFSNNPQDWYSAGTLLVNLLLLLVTALIGVYIYILTSKTGKLPSQKEIYFEILEIIKKAQMILYNPFQKYNDFSMNIYKIIVRLDELKSLSFIFNNEDLAKKTIDIYRGKLELISNNMFIEFGKNLVRFKDDKDKSEGNIKIIEISEKFFNSISIASEEKLLMDGILEAMK